MHIGCADNGGVMNDIIRHRCHPKHELQLLRRRSSFKCDACGTKKLGNSYLCITCAYWIHSRCASLPDTMEREDHHHSLSLSFDVPSEYIDFKYKCEVCHQQFLPKYWIYNCHLCRYAVHIKCAFKKSPHATISNNENGKDILRFPVNEVGGEQIRAFVMKMKLGGIMPPIPDIGDDVKYYEFDHHKHKLSLISSSNIDGEEEEENSDEEDNDYTYKSKLICDGCITPIIFKRERSNHYLSCSSCKYYLHWECFHLPPQLPSLTTLHQQPDHQLLLQSAPKLDFAFELCCFVCFLPMNGLFYGCTRCEFKADINCASLPNTMYHSAHPHHPLNLLHKNDLISKGYYNPWRLQCSAGCNVWVYDYFYVCDSCDEFMLDVGCALLPPSVRNRRWDKHHLLPLTYDANLNHPDEFYCDHCETQMNPKRWMYHCRPCDLSFHPDCFDAASGFFRNIKAGKMKLSNVYDLTWADDRCRYGVRYYAVNTDGMYFSDSFPPEELGMLFQW
ncbi:hypothetical protein C2S52_020993 [Perilla frutescens var. hirtella]|nr:hypothetical protein C2S52_020993 [Perilla frutescens var. hirtella]